MLSRLFTHTTVHVQNLSSYQIDLQSSITPPSSCMWMAAGVTCTFNVSSRKAIGFSPAAKTFKTELCYKKNNTSLDGLSPDEQSHPCSWSICGSSTEDMSILHVGTRPLLTHLSIQSVKQRVACPVRNSAASVSLATLAIIITLTTKGTLINFTFLCATEWHSIIFKLK